MTPIFWHDFLFMARLFIFGTTFYFWHDFLFLARLFIFGTTFNFWHDFLFLARLLIFGTAFYFWHDFQFLARLSIFGATFNFWHEFLFSARLFYFWHDFFTYWYSRSPLSNRSFMWFNMADVSNKRFGLCFLAFFVDSLSICVAVMPAYTPALQNGNIERTDLIERYFYLGLGYNEILLFLGLLHGCFLSIRQLKRLLKQRGLGRRKKRSIPQEICNTIEQELHDSGSTIG